MGKRFWVFLRRYCLESTIVGLKYFYLYPDCLSRCFWALNLVSVLICSSCITWLLYNRFNEMPTRITIENQFEPVLNLPYPTVTLCSPNQMTLSSMKFFNETFINGSLSIDLEEALPMLLGFYELNEEVNEYFLRRLQYAFDLNGYSIIQVMGKMPLSCQRFLQKCLLEGESVDCNELFKPILTTHGYCCAFNSKYYFNGEGIHQNHSFINRTVKSTGFHSSLSILMDYAPDDAIKNTLLNAGSIRVMLTDWTEFPVDYETYLVDSNAEAYLFLRATYTYCSEEVSALPPESRKCNFENERRLAFFHQYRNSDCDHICYVKAVRRSCHCWLFIIPTTKLEGVCDANHIPCIMDVKKNMASWLSTEECDCPRDCESRQYRADLTVGNFDGIKYALLMKSLFNMKVNASTSLMNFLFTNPVYVKQKQETVMSVISLFSNLGGVFGLFMGCSGISVMEIIFYSYKGMRKHLHRRPNPRPNIINVTSEKRK